MADLNDKGFKYDEAIIVNMVIGSTKDFEWDYSESSDILNIHRTGVKTSDSAELGDFTVDFDKEGIVVGLEIINASEFFTTLDISKDLLSDLQGAELVVQKRAGYSFILLKLLLPQQIEKTIPIPAPVLAEVPA